MILQRFINLSVVFALLAGALFWVGCGQPPVQTEAAPQDIPGYTKLMGEFGPLDFTPLRGRSIVLDPGHGGFFRGAVGPGGLAEAEVNLGVALYLRGLLEWAGAEVHLTRSADYDFLSLADSSLSSDLAFRVNFANELQPDVFLSIHHNSTASADPTINETQTYYPLGREGASVDLARSIHRHLVMNLEISPAKILPGNFHVLRQAQVPAVLGEPAMISNPVIEGRLNLAASHELEAKAYFLGLLEYFSAGSPFWSAAAPDTVIIDPMLFSGALSWTFIPGPDAHDPGPDPSSYRLTRDNRPEPIQLSPNGRTVTWAPDGVLPDRPVVLEITGRNLRGRTTPPQRTVLIPGLGSTGNVMVSRESAANHPEPHDLIRWKSSGTDKPFHALTGPQAPGHFDGFALVPSLPDPLAAEVGTFLRGALETPLLTGNFQVDHDIPTALSWRLISAAGQRPDVVTTTPPGGWRNRFFTGKDWPPTLTGYPCLAVPPEESIWLEARGFLPLIDPAPARQDTARTVTGTQRYWVAEKLLPNVDRAIIVLDPAGGGIQTDGTGPLGTRGADINLETALKAKSLLEGAGAEVYLTRTGEWASPNPDKVRLAGQVGADLFLTIGRSTLPAQTTVSHHHGSSTGQAWAEALASAARGLQPADGSASLTVSPSWAYLLRHTACPALEVGFPPLSSVIRENQANTGAWQLAEARTILLSVAAVLGDDPLLEHTLDLASTIAALPQSRVLPRVDWALLDGNFPWMPAADRAPSVATARDSLSYWGGARPDEPGFPALNARHTLEIHHGQRWQVWLLDFSSDEMKARLMMEGT